MAEDMKRQFQFWAEGVTTSLGKSVRNPSQEARIVQGVCSTARKDLDHERVMQEGLDWSYFKDHGVIKYEHNQSKSPTAANVIGFPVSVRPVGKDKTFVRVELYGPGHPESDATWSLLKAIEDWNKKHPDKPRKMGFSIEGHYLDRGLDGIVKAAKVTNLVLTMNPKGTDTYADIVHKALEAGSEQSTTMTGGAAMRHESLEGSGRHKRKKARKQSKEEGADMAKGQDLGAAVEQGLGMMAEGLQLLYTALTPGGDGFAKAVKAKKAKATPKAKGKKVVEPEEEDEDVEDEEDAEDEDEESDEDDDEEEDDDDSDDDDDDEEESDEDEDDEDTDDEEEEDDEPEPKRVKKSLGAKVAEMDHDIDTVATLTAQGLKRMPKLVRKAVRAEMSDLFSQVGKLRKGQGSIKEALGAQERRSAAVDGTEIVKGLPQSNVQLTRGMVKSVMESLANDGKIPVAAVTAFEVGGAQGWSRLSPEVQKSVLAEAKKSYGSDEE
jgi:hypothetical protein